MVAALIACLLAAAQDPPPRGDQPGLYVRGYAGDWAAPGFDFNATRLDGKRKIEGRDVLVGGVELGLSLGKRYFSFVGAERGQAEDLALEAYFIGAGVDFEIGERNGISIRLSPYAAVMAGSVDVDQDDFGDFEDGYGARVGVDLGLPLAAGFSISAFLEGRVMSFDYEEDVLHGDKSIFALGGAAGLGVGFRF